MKGLVGGRILSKIWAIDPAFVQGQLPFIINLLDGKSSKKDFSSTRKALRPYSLHVASSTKDTFAAAPAGSVAVINLCGPLMKNDQECGPEGTASIICEIKEANANPNISAIILKIDSPGGTVDGTETFANEIRNSKKPVVAYVDGMAASAAYWIASACSYIIINGETAALGSIGTMSSFFDYLPFFKAQGIEFHEIYASESFNKNIEYTEALKGNYEPMKSNILNPLNKIFTTTVEKNRSTKIDTSNERVLSGGIFYGKAAVKAGLADEIESFEYAVTKAMELAGGNSINNSTPLPKSENMKIKLNSTMKGLLAKFNISLGEGETEVEKEITPEELADLTQKAESFIDASEKAAIAISEKEAAVLEANNATAALTQAKKENGELIASLQEELATAKTKISTLETVETTKDVVADTEKAVGEAEHSKYLTSADLEKAQQKEKAKKLKEKLEATKK